MMQQRERLYQLDRPILARDAVETAAAQTAIIPPGWIGLEQCNLSPVQGQALRVPHVLLHPDVGVALLDLAPALAEGAEPAFRARLEAARFAAIFPGNLPVVHLQLEPEELGQLGTLLPAAFATLPPLNLPGGDGWVSVVRRALASRGALRDGAESAPLREATARPPMLSREVAAQRAGLSLPPDLPPTTPDRLRARWPGLPIALGLAGLTAVAAAGAVIWVAPRQAETPVAERSGATPTAAAPAVAAGNVVALPPAPVPPPVLAPAVPALARAPDIAVPPPPRDRVVAAPPRAPDPPTPARAATVAATAAPAPPPATAPERPGRVMVRVAANIRTSPNNKATLIRTAPQGEVLREFSRSPDDWVEVGDSKPQGWMFGKFLVPAKP
ncbi:MAG: SH3 domain-containing protein [Paracraurococcus sp.]